MLIIIAIIVLLKIKNNQVNYHIYNISYLNRKLYLIIFLIKIKLSATLIRLNKSNTHVALHSANKKNSKSKEKDFITNTLVKNNSYKNIDTRRDSYSKNNNLNSSNSNINTINNTSNLISLSTNSHLNPSSKHISTIKNKNDNYNINQNIISTINNKIKEDQVSKEIPLNDYNLSSPNFYNEANYKKDSLSNLISNNNHNSSSNNFNSILSNSNFNYSQTLTKYSDNTKINPSFEKCKIFKMLKLNLNFL